VLPNIIPIHTIHNSYPVPPLPQGGYNSIVVAGPFCPEQTDMKNFGRVGKRDGGKKILLEDSVWFESPFRLQQRKFWT